MRVFEPQRRAGLTRVERTAQARRRRAQAHLDRLRGGPAPRRAARPLRLAVPLLLLSLLCGAWVGAAWRRDARVAGLAVQGLQHLAPGEIAAASGLAPGAALADLDTAALAERLAAHDWIASARALPLPSGRILVGVVERQPVAVLGGARPFAVDASGVPFAPVEASALPGLPRLTGPEVVPGEPDAGLADAVALARRLPELGLPVPTEIALAEAGDPQGLSLRLPGLAPRFVLGREDLETRLAELARLLETAQPELERAERVDLRFRGQAVLDVSPSPTGAAQAAAARGRAPASNTRPTG